MGRMTGWLIVAPLAALPAVGASSPYDIGNTPPAFVDSIARGKLLLELRPRYNRIDETDRELRTEGGTVRAIAGWRTAPWYGLRFTLEGIHADHIGPKRFNDDPDQLATSPYPLLPDPRHTGVNQAYVEYAGAEGLRVKAGRQVVRMDNQRWISDNDFRQVPQLFDGVRVAYAGLENAELEAAQFRRIRTTSGETESLRLSLLHAAWNPIPGQALAVYAYFHDQPENASFTGFANNSHRVVGMRLEGALGRGCPIEYPYLLELAQQKPHAGGDSRIDARYWRVGAGLATDHWTLRADYETKGSNDGLYGLQTPLTDHYAFNGWTLHFFNTPGNGLRDRWLTARYAVGPVTLYAEAHRFKSDFGGLDYGRENDIGVTWEAMESLVLRLQHARYEPGAGSAQPHVRKTWLTLTYAF
jgi:hypothetical protein